jgi:hypothetical protein
VPDRPVKLFPQFKQKEAVMRSIRTFLFALGLLAATPANASHNGVSLLDEMRIITVGQCHLTTDNGGLWLFCEIYVDAEDNVYIAFYIGGIVAVVKKMYPDGTQENVWVQGQVST